VKTIPRIAIGRATDPDFRGTECTASGKAGGCLVCWVSAPDSPMEGGIARWGFTGECRKPDSCREGRTSKSIAFALSFLVREI
jgi:hypothetical protein